MDTNVDLNIYHDKQNGIIVTEATGPLTTESVRNGIENALICSREHTCELLLFDLRKCTVERPILEGFIDIHDLMRFEGLTFRHKLAIIYNPVLYPEDRARFIENVVVNRPNPPFRMFREKKEAIAWLKEFV